MLFNKLDEVKDLIALRSERRLVERLVGCHGSGVVRYWVRLY